MKPGKALAPLRQVSGLILDRDLALLRVAAGAMAETRAHLADLAVTPAPGDLPPMLAAALELRFQFWADARRADLNLTLARQTHDWIVARDAARVAFGRADVLRRLSENG